MSQEPVSGDRYVCHNCIGDEFLSTEVRREGVIVPCSYCDKEQNAIKLEALTNRVHGALQEHYELTPDEPETAHELLLYRLGEWERRGDFVDDVIADMAGLDTKIAEDVSKLLGELHGFAPMYEELPNRYGTEAYYEQTTANPQKYQDAWENFREEVLRKSRFFNSTAEEILNDIFGDLTILKTYGPGEIVHTIGPNQ